MTMEKLDALFDGYKQILKFLIDRKRSTRHEEFIIRKLNR